MKHLTVFLSFVTLLQVAELQLFSQRFIPPPSEVGSCRCQDRPLRTTYADTYFLEGVHGVQFRHFSRSSRGDEGIEVPTGDRQKLIRSGFNGDLPLTVVIHGWTEGTTNSNWIYPLKDALLRKSNMNVILVDWSSLSKRSYDRSASHAKYTGTLLADYLKFIKATYPSFTGAQVHLIGFSMGAHIAGIAGYHFRGIARITGLDPAGPAFECINASEHLDPSDANFVDVIHTNAGCYSRGFIGHRTPTGHADFYVNGGGTQPKCSGFFADAVADFLISRNTYVCHHHRSIEYFQESLNAQDTAYAYLCPDYKTFKTGKCLSNKKAAFGYSASLRDLPTSGRGPFTYFLTTQSESSFLSKHIMIAVYLGSNGDTRARGNFIIYFTGRDGRTREEELFKNGDIIRAGQAMTRMIVIPLTSDLSDINFSLSYESRGFNIAIFNGFLDVLKVVAMDYSSNQQYCVTQRESLMMSQKLNRRPILGAC